MKRILFITPRVPFPATSGGFISTMISLKFLAKTFKLDFVTFIDNESDDLEKIKQTLNKLGIKNSYFINFKIKNRSIKNILSAIIYNIPLSIYRNKSVKMKRKIEEIADNYDFIYADHWLTMQNIPKNYKGKVK